MKIYIFADMEGISGVSGGDFVRPDGARYAEGRLFYTMDINTCVAACFEAGADEVLVRDGHGAGNHVLWQELDARVELIQGPTPGVRMFGLAGSDGLILLGYHAMAGTRNALLEHTYSSAQIQNYWLNGRKVGEIGLDAAMAADYGVPTIMVSGDDKACREAKRWIPGVVTCRVKEGLSCQAARLLPMARAHEHLAAMTRRALARREKIKTPRVKRPVVLRKEVVERGRIPAVEQPGCRILDARTWERTADTVEKAFF